DITREKDILDDRQTISWPQIMSSVWTEILLENAAAGATITETASSFSLNWLRDHRRLREALNAAAGCESLIVSEQERLRVLLKDARNDTERDAYEYLIWYVEMHLTRAARIARERLDYFASLNTQEAIDAELIKCSKDKVHWFKYYGWGYD